jgi:hypothetical protein
MLDVNNENLSSESTEKKLNEENEKKPLKSSEKEKVVDDEKEVLSEIKVEDEEGIEKAIEEGITEKVQDALPIVEEEATAEVNDAPEIESKAKKEAKEEDAEQDVAADEIAPEEETTMEVEAVQADAEKPEDETTVPISEAQVPQKQVAKEVPHVDVSKLSMDETVDLMYKLLNEFDIREVKNLIENLKTDFQKKFKTLVAEKKAVFIKEGGNVIDFYYTSPAKEKFDELIREFKRKRQQIYKDIEREQKENLETKLLLIDELKGLIDTADASTMYKNFKALEDKWKVVGQIPHSKYNDVWRTYHHHVERFYDLLHLNNDFRDLDFKHNLEEKTRLIEKAEALAENEDVNYAFKELQILHKMWKEDIGPVARELREEIWERFSEATRKIHQKRHDFQDKLDEKYKANVDLKLAVIEKIKAIELGENDSHRAWQEHIKKLEALREEFFAIGRVPKSKNEEIWQLFRDSTKSFNAAKNAFYKNIKKDQLENLRRKLLLVDEAESMKDSDDWDTATEVYKKVQAEWKNIGHVPRRDSDKIWKRFKDACNHYFDRLHERQNDLGKDQSELIDKKKEFMDHVKNEIEEAKDLSLEYVQESIKNWRSMGALPQKVKHLEAKFNKVLDTAYKKLNIDKEEADFLRFKSGVDSLMDQKNARKLDSEQLFIRRKIDEITKEIKQLENNISFISNASEDNPLVKNVYKHIEDLKVDLEIWKRKISYMNKLEY